MVFSSQPDFHFQSSPEIKKSLEENKTATLHFKPRKIYRHQKPFYTRTPFLFTLIGLAIFSIFSYFNNKNLNQFYTQIPEKIITKTEVKYQKQNFDFGSFLSGTRINYSHTSNPISYGIFYKRQAKPADIVLSGNFNRYNCFAMQRGGQIAFQFPKKINLKNFAILHPYLEKKSSAIKEFEILTIKNEEEIFLGDFIFENKKIIQDFNLTGEFENLIMRVKSTHGKNFCALYKVYFIGCE